VLFTKHYHGAKIKKSKMGEKSSMHRLNKNAIKTAVEKLEETIKFGRPRHKSNDKIYEKGMCKSIKQILSLKTVPAAK
jgi:hypothetical protein